MQESRPEPQELANQVQPRRSPSLSATAFGICLPQGERGLWEWRFYPAAKSRMNWSAPEFVYRGSQDRYDLQHLDELGVRIPA